MFLHVGENKTISVEDMVGIFDVEVIKGNKKGDTTIIEADSIVDFSDKESKSVILTNDGTMYFSPIATSTLQKRFKLFEDISEIDSKGDYTSV